MSRAKNPFAEKLLETAAGWVVRIDASPLTEQEAERFRSWILESESHRAAFEEAASAWGRMDVLRGLSDLFPLDESHKRSAWRTASKAALFATSIAAAGLIVSFLIFGHPKSSGDDSSAAEEIYVTRVGETATIDLDDGSTIVANTDSRLSVRYSETERRVRLERGEAFFEIESDPDRVFSVVVNETTVRAIGTAFSVFRDGASVEVLVSEGRVEVIRNPTTTNDNSQFGQPDERLLLEVGQFAELTGAEARVESFEIDEVARRLFWRQGMLAFDNEPLERVIEEFSRYTTVDIQIGSDEIRDIGVSGFHDPRDLAGMLTALEGGFGIEVVSLGPDQVLLRAAQ